jgi:hypothetical protein
MKCSPSCVNLIRCLLLALTCPLVRAAADAFSSYDAAVTIGCLCVLSPAAKEIVTSAQGPRLFPSFGPEPFSLTLLRADVIDASAYLPIYDRCPDPMLLPSPSDSALVLQLSHCV